MSIDTAYLSLRLEGPLQSWGYDSQYSRRNTGLFPTKSAILGLCCAALGLPRGSDIEAERLKQFRSFRLMILVIPRRPWMDKHTLTSRRLTDFHTIGGGYERSDPSQKLHIPVIAERDKSGRPKLKEEEKQVVVTMRQYFCDAAFGAVLAGEWRILEEVARAVENPVWGVWLGRKACIPTTPVFGGLFDTQDEALSALIGNESLSNFTYQVEVENFEEGGDSLPDEPVSFGSEQRPRAYVPRRVKLFEAVQEPKSSASQCKKDK